MTLAQNDELVAVVSIGDASVLLISKLGAIYRFIFDPTDGTSHLVQVTAAGVPHPDQ